MVVKVKYHKLGTQDLYSHFYSQEQFFKFKH